MKDGVKKFIMLVGAHFPRQKFAGDEAKESIWLRSMNEMLSPYDDVVLLLAADNIVRTRDPEKNGSMFPKPSECLAACDAAKKQAEFEKTPLLPAPRKDPLVSWSEDRQCLAVDLCTGEMGKTALDEGWVIALWNFCRETMRVPSNQEAADLKRRFFDNIKALDGLAECYPVSNLEDAKMAGVLGGIVRSVRSRQLDIADQVEKSIRGELAR